VPPVEPSSLSETARALPPTIFEPRTRAPRTRSSASPRTRCPALSTRTTRVRAFTLTQRSVPPALSMRTTILSASKPPTRSSWDPAAAAGMPSSIRHRVTTPATTRTTLFILPLPGIFRCLHRFALCRRETRRACGPPGGPGTDQREAADGAAHSATTSPQVPAGVRASPNEFRVSGVNSSLGRPVRPSPPTSFRQCASADLDVTCCRARHPDLWWGCGNAARAATADERAGHHGNMEEPPGSRVPGGSPHSIGRGSSTYCKENLKFAARNRRWTGRQRARGRCARSHECRPGRH
jgi:hypothetical protein